MALNDDQEGVRDYHTPSSPLSILRTPDNASLGPGSAKTCYDCSGYEGSLIYIYLMSDRIKWKRTSSHFLDPSSCA